MSQRRGPGRAGLGLASLIVAQALCAAFFLSDALADFADIGPGALTTGYVGIEAAAALLLAAGIVVEFRMLMGLLRDQARLQRGLSIASGALEELMQGYFRDWRLTPSEADVARLTIKGMTIGEIAGLRGSAEGTIKTHLNAIYRKSGVTGRGALMALLIEDLMAEPLVADAPASPAQAGEIRSGKSGSDR